MPKEPMTTPIDDLAGIEPLSEAGIAHWRQQVAHRMVEPDLTRWSDKDVMVVVGRFLATLDAARSAPVPASNVSEGLREALVAALRAIRARGEASALSGSHVHWTDEDVASLILAEPGMAAALAHAAPEERRHSHLWIDGELHLNGCTLPHDYPRMTFSQPDATEEKTNE